jgi:inner membrane protein
MENLTHSLTGYFLSHAGLNRFTPHATLLLILAANAPDIDILTVAGGGLNYFHYHRGITHAIAFAPVLAIALVALYRLVFKTIPWLPAFFVALAGIASHLLLDLTNDYGIRLFLPFDGTWPALDICAIYDLWIFAFFFVCLTAPLLSKLVGSEIGAAGRQRYPSRTFPILALLFVMFYDAGRYMLHERALAVLDARTYDDEPAQRVAAFPNPFNPLRWQGLAETKVAYRIYDLDLAGGFNPAQGQTEFKPETTPSIPAEPFRILRDFARFPLWHTIPVDNGTEVTLTDLRFPFYSIATLDRSGKILSSEFHFSR